MKTEFLSKGEESVSIILKDTDAPFVNTLRRLIMDYVPVMAVEEAEIIENSSAMYDEALAHRLGLMVLLTDIKSYTLKRDCACGGKGCARCELWLEIKAKGPKIVCAEEVESTDPKVKPVHPKMPIVKLLAKQSIHVKMKAVMGEGIDHVKFSPGLVYYQGYPSIKIGDIKDAAKIAAVCPKKVFVVKDKKLVIDDDKKCFLCNACVDETNGEISVKGSNENFIFHIEPWGQLRPDEMLLKATDIMNEKIDEMLKLLKKID